MADIDSNLPVKDAADGADGAVAPSLTQQIGGLDGSGNLQSMSVDTTGRLNTNSVGQDISLTAQTFRTTSIDSANSRSTVLGANAVFTGTFVDVSGYSTLSIVVFSDQASATNGLTIQYSSDGTNVDDNDQYTIPASNGQMLSFPLAARYYRVVYTNGAVAQTIFRLQAKVHVNAPKPSSIRSSDSLNLEQDTELVKSILMAQTGTTSFDNVMMTTGKELRTAQISNGGGVQGAITVGTTAVLVAVSGTNLANRINVTLYNNSLLIVYWGYTNAVTTTTGTPIAAGQSMSWDVGPNTNIYVISTLAGQNTRITEAAG